MKNLTQYLYLISQIQYLYYSAEKSNMCMKMILSKFKYPELNQLQIWCYGTCNMKRRIILLQLDHISENSVLCQVHFNHC